MNNLRELTGKLYYMCAFDGSLEYSKNKDMARLRVVQVAINKEYLDYVGETLEALDIGYTITHKTNNSGFKNSKPQLVLSTTYHPKLATIRKRLYLGGRKTLDPHMIKFLTAETFTIMLMADGSSYKRNETASPAYYLHLNSFTYAENLLMKQALKKYLNMEWNVVKNKKWWELRMRATSVQSLYDAVFPHILPCFDYKIK